MVARTIVGLCSLLALLGVTIYLLFQIPWEFVLAGILALVGIYVAIAHDAPKAL